MTESQRLVDELALEHPQALRLAECISLAVYAEPALLRRMRHEVLPGVPAAAEADLWFSALVQSASPRGIVLEPGVLDVLRTRIARSELFGAARDVVAAVHRNEAEIIRVEEQIISAALDPAQPDAVVQEHLARALATMADATRAEGVAAWASRAIAALPRRARESPGARALSFAAAAHLGEPVIAVGEPPAGIGLEYLLPSTDRVAAGVRLLDAGVEVSIPPGPDAHPIELPGPLFLGIGAAGGAQASRWVALEHDRTVTVAVGEVVARDVETGAELGRVPAWRGAALVACDGSSGRVAVAAYDDDDHHSTIACRNFANGALLSAVRLPARPVALIFDYAGEELVASCEDGIVRRIVVDSGVVREVLSGVVGAALAAREGETLACTRTGVAHAGAAGTIFERPADSEADCAALALRDGVAAAAYSDRTVYEWNLRSSIPQPNHRLISEAVATGLAYSPNDRLAIASAAGVHVRGPDQRWTIVVSTPAIGVAWSSATELVVVHDDAWTVVDAAGGLGVRSQSEARAVTVSSGGRILACSVAVDAVDLRTIAGEAFALEAVDEAAPEQPAISPEGTGESHFDAIIVGSGFGGSVTAHRLAEAGLRVCVLERGKAFSPGSFPRGTDSPDSNYWDPSAGLHGMFHLWSFESLDVVCASGLGGGSLIYANVLARKDEDWFVREEPGRGSWKGGHEHWPVTRADLDPHYDRVERMLGAQKYPLDQAPYDATPKTLALRDAAMNLGLEWNLVNLAVTFGNPGRQPSLGEPILESRPNLHGRPRQTCRLCGECDIGCNYGSKNTLDFTYLTAAWHAGAELRTRCEVRALEPRDGGGYAIDYVIHDPGNEGQLTDTSRLERRRITAERLIMSAGALGTTWLLLKNRAAFPLLSSELGARFSGNGDMLTYARGCTEESADGALAPRKLDPDRGPVVTSAVRVADNVDGGEGRGFYVEDFGLGYSTQLLRVSLDRRDARKVPARSKIAGDDSSADLALLGLGRDVPDGQMELYAGGLAIDWPTGSASKQFFERMRKVSRAVAEELGGEFRDSTLGMRVPVLTGHPLGGCPMGRDALEGVVDSHGRVFNYPGLYIADGSVMPGPVGPSPALTIAALADRFADKIIEEATGSLLRRSGGQA